MSMLIRFSLAIGIVAATTAMLPAQEQPKQEGLGQRIGKKLDRGLNDLSKELRQGWAEIRSSVDRLGVQGRVYGRLRWDKATAGAPIEIQVEGEDVVVLSGSVPKESARKKAVELANDTVGVREVVDKLRVEPAK
ncbi:MAG TPA: BON domain-containing protein, partial [Burkholderiaceae bacterium]|nr:BON domain-containing protein [Burkholderiaceae bacterium]